MWKKVRTIQLVLWVLVCIICATAATTLDDRAVLTAMRKADPDRHYSRILRRTSINDRLDAVLVFASHARIESVDDGFVFSPADSLGLFLQDRQNPNLVYRIDVEAGDVNCLARVERLSASDAVISCTVEMVRRPYRKFVFDPRAKALVRHFVYPPFSGHRILVKGDTAIFVVSDEERILAVEYQADRVPPFQVLSKTAARPWLVGFKTVVGSAGEHAFLSTEPVKGPNPALPALPATTFEQFAAARPGRVKDGYSREAAEFHECIGPWQKEGDLLWFGKSFYDGEGSTGVGGFGYFDIRTHQLKLFQPPEVADWSVSGIAVSSEAVWMQLARFGEGYEWSGGLLRFDRRSQVTRCLEFPDLAEDMARLKDQILIASDFGIAIVSGDTITRYFVDQMSDGRYRVVPSSRANAAP